jgi:hypothetical protein
MGARLNPSLYPEITSLLRAAGFERQPSLCVGGTTVWRRLAGAEQPIYWVAVSNQKKWTFRFSMNGRPDDSALSTHMTVELVKAQAEATNLASVLADLPAFFLRRLTFSLGVPRDLAIRKEIA